MEHLKRLFLFLLVIFLSVGSYFLYWRSNVRRLEFIFTSDGHGSILPERAYWRDENPDIGGLGALSTFLKGISAPYILTDSGDIFQGTPEGVLTEGRVVIRLMNHLGYDAAALGNHEFDLGQEVLSSLASDADFPLLGANIRESDTGGIPGYLSPYTVKTLNGIDVGIIGVITPGMDKISIPKNIENLEFMDTVPVISSAAEVLREKGVEIIVVLSHCGLKHDLKVAEELKGEVDLILGGHTHRRLYNPRIKGRVLVCQPGSNFNYAGRLALFYCERENRTLSYAHRLEPLYIEKYPPDGETDIIIEEYTADVSEKLNEVIGESLRRLPGSLTGEDLFHRELALGNWQADVMREVLETDFAFQNTGGIRGDIPEGEIKVRDIWTLSPFGNHLVKMELTGAQIRALLEQSAAQEYSFLQVSGLQVLYNSSLPEGGRVLNVIAVDPEGERYEIEDEGSYTVATNSFLAQGGDGYTVFTEGEEISEKELLLRDVLIDYIREKSPVYAEKEGRIINVSRSRESALEGF